MFKKFASLITLSAFVFSLSAQIAYRIEINSKLNDGDTLILANYFGDKQYAKDTAFAQNGKALFSGQNALSNGVYLVVMPQKNYFEMDCLVFLWTICVPSEWWCCKKGKD